MAFQFGRFRQAFNQTDTMSGRQRITEQYLQSLVRLGLRKLDRQRYGLVFARLSELLGMSPAAVKDAVGHVTARPADRSEGSAAEGAPARRLTAAERAERYIIGCLLNSTDLFHTEMADGLPLDEAVVPEDFSDEAHRRLYSALCAWLAEREAGSTTHEGAAGGGVDAADLRSMLEDEELLQIALNLQLEVDSLTEGSHDRLMQELRGSAAAMARNRSAQEYQQEKQRIRSEPPVSGAAPDAEVARRLDLVKQHHHPNAGRFVRPLE